MVIPQPLCRWDSSAVNNVSFGFSQFFTGILALVLLFQLTASGVQTESDGLYIPPPGFSYMTRNNRVVFNHEMIPKIKKTLVPDKTNKSSSYSMENGKAKPYPRTYFKFKSTTYVATSRPLLPPSIQLSQLNKQASEFKYAIPVDVVGREDEANTKKPCRVHSSSEESSEETSEEESSEETSSSEEDSSGNQCHSSEEVSSETSVEVDSAENNSTEVSNSSNEDENTTELNSNEENTTELNSNEENTTEENTTELNSNENEEAENSTETEPTTVANVVENLPTPIQNAPAEISQETTLAITSTTTTSSPEPNKSTTIQSTTTGPIFGRKTPTSTAKYSTDFQRKKLFGFKPVGYKQESPLNNYVKYKTTTTKPVYQQLNQRSGPKISIGGTQQTFSLSGKYLFKIKRNNVRK